MAVARVCAAIFTAACAFATATPQGVSTTDPAVLESGKTLDREFTGGETHEYLVRLKAGQYTKLLLGQQSINVAVA